MVGDVQMGVYGVRVVCCSREGRVSGVGDTRRLIILCVGHTCKLVMLCGSHM